MNPIAPPMPAPPMPAMPTDSMGGLGSGLYQGLLNSPPPLRNRARLRQAMDRREVSPIEIPSRGSYPGQ